MDNGRWIVKRLYLFRHAKSDRADPGIADFDRPLAPRGRRNAPAIAAIMRERGYIPDFILCSPARRAHETLAGLQPILGQSIPVRLDNRLYLAEAETIWQIIREFDRRQASLLVIGHNPGLGQLALHLARRGNRDDLRRLRAKYPTGALAILDFDVKSWQQAEAGTLVDFTTPATLEAD